MSAAALGHARMDAVQRERLSAIVAALRVREPIIGKEKRPTH